MQSEPTHDVICICVYFYVYMVCVCVCVFDSHRVESCVRARANTQSMLVDRGCEYGYSPPLQPEACHDYPLQTETRASCESAVESDNDTTYKTTGRFLPMLCTSHLLFVAV